MTDPNRLPEKFYRRRRLAAVVAVLIVVALIVWVLSALARGGGSDGAEETEENVAASGQTTASVAEAPEDEEAAAADPSGTADSASAGSSGSAGDQAGSADATASDAAAEPAEDPEETEQPPADAREDCDLQDLQIRATSDQVTYPADVQPTFYMTVINPTRTDCEIDLDENTLRFEVYDLATNNRLWSDIDCFNSVQSGTTTFEAGEERFFESVWSRTASAPGQCEDRPVVPAGSYLLHTVIGDNPSEPHTFNLR